MKTAELQGAALDWAVSKCWGIIWEQGDLDAGEYGPGFRPSTNWEDGGPIIERERINVDPSPDSPEWYSYYDNHGAWYAGHRPLIAAMRCYVASKLGDEVDIPEELI